MHIFKCPLFENGCEMLKKISKLMIFDMILLLGPRASRTVFS